MLRLLLTLNMEDTMNTTIAVIIVGAIAVIVAAIVALRRENKAEVAVQRKPVIRHSIEQRARWYATEALPNSWFTKRRTKARRKAGKAMLAKAPRNLRRALSTMYGV